MSLFRNSFDQRAAFSYIALYGLIVLYANAYSIWAFLSAELGVMANYVPIALSALVLVVIITILVMSGSKHSSLTIKRYWLIAGLICVIIALMLPDGNAPAKKIHVPEYLLLSFAVFALQRQKLSGLLLIIFCVLITTLYGAHDEMIQGLLPARSFGYKDIVVDGLSGLGGVCIAYALIQNRPRPMDLVPLFVRRDKSDFVAKKWFSLTMFLVTIQVILIIYGSSKSALFWVIPYFIIVSGSYWFSLSKTNLWTVNKSGMITIYCLAFSLFFYLSSTTVISSLIFK